MGREILDRMPDKVQQVEFTEVQRTPSGLTRVVRASDSCSLSLERGCVVVRELVEERGRRVVKTVALPLNSGLVRSVHMEDEVLEEPAVHPGGLETEVTAPPIGLDALTSGQQPSPSGDHYGLLTPPGSHGAGVAESTQQSSGEASHRTTSESVPENAEEATLNRRQRRR